MEDQLRTIPWHLKSMKATKSYGMKKVNYIVSKQWEEAEACYLNATEIRYTYGEAWLKLAQIKERRDKLSEAEDACVIV